MGSSDHRFRVSNLGVRCCHGAYFALGFLIIILTIMAVLLIVWCYFGLAIVQVSDSQRRALVHYSNVTPKAHVSTRMFTSPPSNRTTGDTAIQNPAISNASLFLRGSSRGEPSPLKSTPEVKESSQNATSLAKGDFAARDRVTPGCKGQSPAKTEPVVLNQESDGETTNATNSSEKDERTQGKKVASPDDCRHGHHESAKDKGVLGRSDTGIAPTHVHKPDSMTHVHRPASTPHVHKPDSTPHVHKPDTTAHVHKPDSTPHVHKPDTTAHVHKPDTTAHVHEPDTTSHVHEPDTTSHVHEPHSITNISLVPSRVQKRPASSEYPEPERSPPTRRDEIQSSRSPDTDTGYRDPNFDRDFPRRPSRGSSSRYDEDDNRGSRSRYDQRDRGRHSDDRYSKGDTRVYADDGRYRNERTSPTNDDRYTRYSGELRPRGDDDRYRDRDDRPRYRDDDQRYKPDEDRYRSRYDDRYRSKDDDRYRSRDDDRYRSRDDDRYRSRDDDRYRSRDDDRYRSRDDDRYRSRYDDRYKSIDGDRHRGKDDDDDWSRDGDGYRPRGDGSYRPRDDERYRSRDDERYRSRDDGRGSTAEDKLSDIISHATKYSDRDQHGPKGDGDRYKDDTQPKERDYGDPLLSTREYTLPPFERRPVHVRADSGTRDYSRDSAYDYPTRDRTRVSIRGDSKSNVPLRDTSLESRYRDDEYKRPYTYDERDRISPTRVKDEAHVSRSSPVYPRPRDQLSGSTLIDSRRRGDDRYPDDSDRTRDTKYYEDEDRRIIPSHARGSTRRSQDDSRKEYRTRLLNERGDTKFVDRGDEVVFGHRSYIPEEEDDYERRTDSRTRTSYDDSRDTRRDYRGDEDEYTPRHTTDDDEFQRSRSRGTYDADSTRYRDDYDRDYRRKESTDERDGDERPIRIRPENTDEPSPIMTDRRDQIMPPAVYPTSSVEHGRDRFQTESIGSSYRPGISDSDADPDRVISGSSRRQNLDESVAERPLNAKDVIDAALRQSDQTDQNSRRKVFYPVFDPRVSNLTSPDIIRPSERRGTTIMSRRKRWISLL